MGHLDHLDRRVEVGAGLAVGARAVVGDGTLDVAHLTGEPADGVVGLGLEVGASGPRVVAGRLEAITFGLVGAPDLAPHGDPHVVGGAGELGDGGLQLRDVVDHGQPPPVEPAVLDDEGILGGGESELECHGCCSWNGDGLRGLA
jgi:hypothetical protein